MSTLRLKTPRLAVRAIIVEDDRLLLVNAWSRGQSDLLCAPGGGVEPHSSLPDNLRREVHEETGLDIDVGPVCLVNEFHSPDQAFHQVDIYFRCRIKSGEVSADWTDPEGVVHQRIWATWEEMSNLRFKPDSLAEVAFGAESAISYDPLELLVK